MLKYFRVFRCTCRFSTLTDKLIKDLAESLDQPKQVQANKEPLSIEPLQFKQPKQPALSQGNRLLVDILNQTPSYKTFRAYELNLAKVKFLMERISQKKDINPTTKAYFMNNLLTYARKNWGKSVNKANQEYIQVVLDCLGGVLEDTRILPGLVQNIQYTFQPELYTDQVSTIILNNAYRMQTNEIANCLYSLSKTARKRVQDAVNPMSNAAIDKNVLYNSAQLTLTRLIPTLLLKNWDELQPLTECLIAYQKLELTEEQSIGLFLIKQVQQLLTENTKFSVHLSQLTHTLMKYQDYISSDESEVIIQLQRTLFTSFLRSTQSLPLKSICLSLHAFNQIDQSLISQELVEECQKHYCEKEAQANIQDLSMLMNVSFSKQIMIPHFSQIITNHYDLLKNNVDINVINSILPNIGDSINKRHLEKKFINLFLISIKIIHDQGKINQRFIKAFIEERKKIENEEIQRKFNKIEFLITHS